MTFFGSQGAISLLIPMLQSIFRWKSFIEARRLRSSCLMKCEDKWKSTRETMVRKEVEVAARSSFVREMFFFFQLDLIIQQFCLLRNFYSSWQAKLLNNEIKLKKKNISRTKDEPVDATVFRTIGLSNRLLLSSYFIKQELSKRYITQHILISIRIYPISNWKNIF